MCICISCLRTHMIEALVIKPTRHCGPAFNSYTVPILWSRHTNTFLTIHSYTHYTLIHSWLFLHTIQSYKSLCRCLKHQWQHSHARSYRIAVRWDFPFPLTLCVIKRVFDLNNMNNMKNDRKYIPNADIFCNAEGSFQFAESWQRKLKLSMELE